MTTSSVLDRLLAEDQRVVDRVLAALVVATGAPRLFTGIELPESAQSPPLRGS